MYPLGTHYCGPVTKAVFPRHAAHKSPANGKYSLSQRNIPKALIPLLRSWNIIASETVEYYCRAGSNGSDLSKLEVNLAPTVQSGYNTLSRPHPETVPLGFLLCKLGVSEPYPVLLKCPETGFKTWWSHQTRNESGERPRCEIYIAIRIQECWPAISHSLIGLGRAL